MRHDDEYRQLVKTCAEQGQALARLLANRGTFEALYLYSRPSEPGKPGALFLARETAPNPLGYPLVTGEGLRGNVPYNHYFQWVYERARRAPILSID
ncbi:MAG: hypothetical protein RL563_2652 [Pseudomonadota bacterium]|jgi:hypothetical protein